MEMDSKLQQLREEKCTIADCEEKQGMFMEVGMGMMLPFCMNHAMKMMELKPKWDKSAFLVEKDLRRNTGKMIIIKNYEEWRRRVKSHFQEISTQGLVLTKGICIECGRKAIGCRYPFKPLCEEHLGFPLNVLEVAIRT